METVDTFLPEVQNLVGSSERMGALLALEQRRRGLTQARLLFVGVASVGSVRGCAMEAVLKSRAREPMFFASYLQDRLVYAARLGRIRELPPTDEAILAVGSDITLADVES